MGLFVASCGGGILFVLFSTKMDCVGLDGAWTLWLARAKASVWLLGLCTILGVHSPPPACLRLELQRARGIRLFN